MKIIRKRTAFLGELGGRLHQEVEYYAPKGIYTHDEAFDKVLQFLSISRDTYQYEMDEENELLAEQVNRLFNKCFKKCAISIVDGEVPPDYRKVPSLDLYKEVCETKEKAKIKSKSSKNNISDVMKDLF